MSDNHTDSPLEAARARLEGAMSRLAQSAAGAREARQQIIHLAAEKAAFESRIAALEQENLKLHEQVATLSLKDSSPDSDEALAAARAELQAVERNYSLLKQQYANVQDELEGLREAQAPSDGSGEMESKLRAENAELKKAIMVLKSERDDIRKELDSNIAKLETLVEDA